MYENYTKYNFIYEFIVLNLICISSDTTLLCEIWVYKDRVL